MIQYHMQYFTLCNIYFGNRDTYDFTEFKNLKEYTDSKDAIIDDILSTTLNNLAVVSSEYGVIKTYDVIIRFEAKEGEF